MNIALVFAAGVGIRMNSKAKPKQFLEMHGKPILVYTLEHFDRHPDIDAICVVCLEQWIPELKRQISRWQIQKVIKIVSGGNTSQQSIYRGLKAIQQAGTNDGTVVLIHDGVRPLIDGKLISDNLETVRKYGNSITTALRHETAVSIDDNGVIRTISDRAHSRVAKAPQCFYLQEILALHERAIEEGLNSFIDCASMCHYYGMSLHTTECGQKNIKVTTAEDYYIFRALFEAEENTQIYGI